MDETLPLNNKESNIPPDDGLGEDSQHNYRLLRLQVLPSPAEVNGYDDPINKAMYEARNMNQMGMKQQNGWPVFIHRMEKKGQTTRFVIIEVLDRTGSFSGLRGI